MSKLRPELCNPTAGTPCPYGVTAYVAIMNSVQCQKGLIHGRLEFRGAFCAIGSFFDAEPHTALPSELIDEVAAINDSCPTFTPERRRKTVLTWLRWKLRSLGYPIAGRKPAAAS